MSERFKFPQSYLLLWAPFRAFSASNSDVEAFRMGFGELFEPVYDEERHLNEFPCLSETDSPIAMEDALRDARVESDGRAALLIWTHRETLLRVEAALFNAAHLLRVKKMAHLICFIQPDIWLGLQEAPRARLKTPRTCVIDPPTSNEMTERPPILAVRSSIHYEPDDIDIFARCLKGEYPPVTGKHTTIPPRGEHDSTLEFNVADVVPKKLRDTYKKK